jgi:hemerythrin-like metal-binding protein
VIDREAGFHNRLAAGALAGELSALSDEPSRRTFRAESAIAALRIPCDSYRDFIRRNGLEESVLRIRENRQVLFNTRLFGEMSSFSAQREIARVMEKRQLAKGQYATHGRELCLFLLAEGEISLQADGTPIENISAGDYWGEMSVVEGIPAVCQAQALRDSLYFAIPAESLLELPSVYLKLLETFDRRMKILNTRFRFEWQDFYAVGVADIDDQHKKIFALVNDLSEHAAAAGGAGARRGEWAGLLEYVRSHLEKEESLLKKHGYPRLTVQQEDHKTLLSELEDLVRRGESGHLQGPASTALLKDWIIRHTLLEDRLFKEFFEGRAEGKNSRRG